MAKQKAEEVAQEAEVTQAAAEEPQADAGAAVAKNNEDAAKALQEKIDAEVDARVKAALLEKDAQSVLLNADEYAPRYQKTLIPVSSDAPVNPKSWLIVEKEDFNADHAQLLIDHFRSLEGQKDFNFMTAVNTQLVKK